MVDVTTVSASHEDGPPKKDWELAKALYISNISKEEIMLRARVSEAALNKRIVREGWVRLRNGAAVVKADNIAVQQAKGEPLRDMLKSKLPSLIQSFPKSLGKTPRAQMQVSSAFNSLTESARKLESWADAPTAHLDIHVLASSPTDLGAKADIVDVEEVKPE